MNLCSDGHEEICHESRKCPVCEALAEKDNEIESLKEKIENLQSKLTDAINDPRE